MRKAWKAPVVVTGVVPISHPAIRSAATTITRGSAAVVAPLPLFVRTKGRSAGGSAAVRSCVARYCAPTVRRGSMAVIETGQAIKIKA